MIYKFKVDVYRQTPYRGVMLALVMFIAVPAFIVLLQKTDDVRPAVHAPILAAPIYKPAVAPKKDLAHKKGLAHTFRTMSLASSPLRKFKCIFEGKATYESVPYPGATVLAKVTTRTGTLTGTAKTDADGSYRIEVPVRTALDDSLDWSIEAYTTEFKKVELIGRRIVTEDAAVSIEQQLAFLPH